MLPDLRLLIPATVLTFLLAAVGGLYASIRISHEPMSALADSRMAIDEQSPIMRISASWPLPEPGRSAALRELASAVKYSTLSIPDPASAPAVPSEPDVRTAIPESNSLSSGESGEQQQSAPERVPQENESAARVAARPDSIEQDATAKTAASAANVKNDPATTAAKAADKKKPARTTQRKKRKIVVSGESGSLSNDTYVANSTVPVAN